MFSNLSSSSISLATVTPSLVMRGAPNDLSSTTLRPFGPSVTRTALASVSMPRNILSRASPENFTSLAAILLAPLSSLLSRGSPPRAPGFRSVTSLGWRNCSDVPFSPTGTGQTRTGERLGRLALTRGLVQHAHNVAFLHDQILDAIDLHLGAGPFAEQHPVAGFDVEL